MKKNKLCKYFFKHIIKYGIFLFEHPVLLTFKIFGKNEFLFIRKRYVLLIGTLVKKQYVKKSVHRNKIKRLFRASFVENQNNIICHDRYICIIFIYKSFSKILPKYCDINLSIKNMFNRINHICNN